MVTTEKFKLGQIAELLGIEPKELQNAVDAGYVRAASPARGRGHVRFYQAEQVYYFAALWLLWKTYGLKKQWAAEVLREVWPKPFKPLNSLRINPDFSSDSLRLEVPLPPIELPLNRIVSSLDDRIRKVRGQYREKKRGRPPGWSKAMGQTLGQISQALEPVDDLQIKREIASYRAETRKQRR
jgi:hypothetical protein